MDFKDFKEKYFKKNVEEMRLLLKENKGIFKEVENIDIVVRAVGVAREILNLEHSIDYFYVFQEYYITFANELDLFLNIENIPTVEDMDFSDFDINLKNVLEEIPYIKMFKDMVKDTINSVYLDSINELTKALEETNISNDDLERAEKSLKNMFEGQGEERLKLIESILAYNDPNLKNIKDFIYDPKITIKEEVLNDIASGESKVKQNENSEQLKSVKNIKAVGDNITNQINSMEPVKVLDEQLRQEQQARVLEYKQKIDKILKENKE